MHGDTYLGKISEPVSRKFDFFFFCKGRLPVRNFAGPLRRIIRERVLRDKAHLLLAILQNSNIGLAFHQAGGSSGKTSGHVTFPSSFNLSKSKRFFV